LPKIEEDGKSWLRRSKLYKGVVEPYKKKKKYNIIIITIVLQLPTVFSTVTRCTGL
jgi:hypothetical protein